jgi:isoleucyl-tRNA synthetase
MDILDVWFDSGVSHAAVMETDERLSWPADMYLEGSDQHRGWFQSSLLASVGTRGKAPYRTVLTHGFTVDGQGKKMSKSLGNVIAPQEVIKGNGAEILRLWVSAEDYRDDVRISKEILDRLTEAYRKIRNTCRFLLGNISDFDNMDYSSHLLEIDRWAMSRLQTFTGKVTAAYDNFDFHEVFHCIYRFCVIDMSSFYLDVLKDRLYTSGSDSGERRAAQWVLHQVLSTMTRLMAPVLSFTAEEVWQSLKNSNQYTVKSIQEMEESVFLSVFPEIDGKYYDQKLEEKWDALFLLRSEVNKALEIKRAEKFLGNSLEAKIVLYLPDKYKMLVSENREFLPTFFIVSAVELADNGVKDSYKSIDIEGLEVSVERAIGVKCQRCWNWSEAVGTFTDAPDICDRCHKVILSR